jgi:hypothetical protein
MTINGTNDSITSTTEVISAAENMKQKLQKYKDNLCGFLPRLALILDPRISSKHPRNLDKEAMRIFLSTKYNFDSNT